MVVLFPAPFGPSIATISSSRISRSTPSSTVLSPYVMRRSDTETIGAPRGVDCAVFTAHLTRHQLWNVALILHIGVDLRTI